MLHKLHDVAYLLTYFNPMAVSLLCTLRVFCCKISWWLRLCPRLCWKHTALPQGPTPTPGLMDSLFGLQAFRALHLRWSALQP